MIENGIVTQVEWETASDILRRIRTDVFMVEQQVPAADEWDGKDQNAAHFLVHASSEALGCARILIEQIDGTDHYHIGRVAVQKHYRGRGLGSQLMQALIEWCRQGNPNACIYLHAQTSRRAFYERLGFVAREGEFMDAGIAHIHMTYDKG